MDGVMVAYYPPALVRQALAAPGGLDPAELHVTLAHLGPEADLDPDVLAALPNALKQLYDAPAEVTISGTGRFYDTDPGVDAVYASLDSPALTELRTWVVNALESQGASVSRKHGFTPHITLAYVPATTMPADTPSMNRELVGTTFAVDTLSLVVAGERRDFYLDVESDMVLLSEPVRENAPEVELTGPIVRKDALRRIAYGAVLVPGEPDSDGEVLTAGKIEDVAHEWMERYANIDLQHSLNAVDARPVESYITDADRVVQVDGQDVVLPVGSWVLASKVRDEAVWKAIESGELAGYSVMGVRHAAMKSETVASYKRTLLKDLGADWVAPFVSIVDRPAVPKAKLCENVPVLVHESPNIWDSSRRRKMCRSRSRMSATRSATRSRLQ
jgi:2'-5' RNA ligase